MSIRWLLAAGLCVASTAVAVASNDSAERFLPNPNKAAVDDGVGQASVQGKYRVLLRKLYMPEDVTNYGHFKEYGAWQGTAYAQWNDLPVGYWVYQQPHWYIWRDCVKPNAEAPGLPPR